MLSERTRDVLRKYPTWKEKVEQSMKMPPFKFDYVPSVIEIFDSEGLLGGTAWGQVYETQRLKEQQCEFVAWCLDGQLGVFYVGSEIIVNRCELMAQGVVIVHNSLEAV